MISSSTARRSRLKGVSENECRILRTESDTVRKRISDTGLARNTGNIVEITLGIRIFEIQGRRNNRFLHGEEDGADTACTTRTLRMAHHRLRRTCWNLLRALLKTMFDGTRFNPIIETGR